MSNLEIAFWIALPSIAGLFAIGAVLFALWIRRHLPPVRKD